MLNLKEFNYILWKDSEGRCFVKVKDTDEVTEVSEQVFKDLRNEEKRIYRELELKDKLYSEDEEERNKSSVMYPISYDMFDDDGDEDVPAWLEFKEDLEDIVISRDLENNFLKNLTEEQKEVFVDVLLGGETYRDFARRKGMTHQNVTYMVSCIRKKFKKFLV